MQRRVITDLCISIISAWKPTLAWSPDNVHLAFAYDGYPIILNTATLEMQILRYETGTILGWYALADE